MNQSHVAPLRLGLLASLLVAVTACSGSGSSPAPTSGAPTSTPGPALQPVDDAEAAMDRIVKQEPMFEDVQPFDPDVIGACCWYRAMAVENGYRVTIEMGWGDCPSGCINRHQWEYAVASTGEVTLLSESGPSFQPGGGAGGY